MRYYISDLHFFHNRLNFAFDNRGFSNSEEMNEYMIKQWNKKVKKNDEVIILGDISIAGANETNELLKQLNGIKYLIIGNHDKFLKDKNFDRTAFKWIKEYAVINDNKRKIVLSHYPILFYDGQYSKNINKQPKTYMLYGHIHDSKEQELVLDFQNQIKNTVNKDEQKIPCNMINCFCMYSDYQPLTLDEWIDYYKNRGDISNE